MLHIYILYYNMRCFFVCLVSMESHTVQLTHMTFILSEPGWAWAGFRPGQVLVIVRLSLMMVKLPYRPKRAFLSSPRRHFVDTPSTTCCQ